MRRAITTSAMLYALLASASCGPGGASNAIELSDQQMERVRAGATISATCPSIALGDATHRPTHCLSGPCNTAGPGTGCFDPDALELSGVGSFRRDAQPYKKCLGTTGTCTPGGGVPCAHWSAFVGRGCPAPGIELPDCINWDTALLCH